MSREPQNRTTHELRKILVATDFSAASERARDYAIALSAPSTTMTLLHAQLLPFPDWPEPAYVPEWMCAEPSMREEGLARLRLFGAPALAAGLVVRPALQEGLPAEVILAQAATLQPDLIAMGTHGRRGLERWAMGSTAERVVRLAAAPVLTVSAQGLGPPSRIREVLCPLSLASGAEALAFASAVAGRAGSPLTVLHVLESAFGHAPGRWREQEARERLLEAVVTAGLGGHAEILLRSGRPAREILRMAGEHDVDVIIMGGHDRAPGTRRCFAGTPDEVVREATCAVIRMPPWAADTESREASEARMLSL